MSCIFKINFTSCFKLQSALYIDALTSVRCFCFSPLSNKSPSTYHTTTRTLVSSIRRYWRDYLCLWALTAPLLWTTQDLFLPARNLDLLTRNPTVRQFGRSWEHTVSHCPSQLLGSQLETRPFLTRIPHCAWGWLLSVQFLLFNPL